jgi:hypothetical protein
VLRREAHRQDAARILLVRGECRDLGIAILDREGCDLRESLKGGFEGLMAEMDYKANKLNDWQQGSGRIGEHVVWRAAGTMESTPRTITTQNELL